MPASPASAPVILPHHGITPTLGEKVFIAPGAIVIGDVAIGARASVWFGCVVRGDDNYIRIGDDTNIQDGTIIHISKDMHPTVVGSRVTVGHGAILHGCTVEDDAMIGIGATVLDGAVVCRGAVVAAGAVVSPGKRVGPGEMWAGVPAKLQRAVKPEETAFIARNAPHYHALAMSYLAP
jgi:carbonic anhydrase/acetyltransferase-like protein (isoleucine patch superfamily)